jgi:hypothetical protein
MTRRRGVRHRYDRASRRPVGLLLLFFVGLACGERERPDPLSDPPLDGTRRFVGGDFGAPSFPDAGAGGAGLAAGGAAADAGTGPAGGNGGSAGASGSPVSTSAVPITQTQTYEASCEASRVVQWGFVTFEASTPGDSFITFRVRSAQTEAELAAATFIDLISVSTGLPDRPLRTSRWRAARSPPIHGSGSSVASSQCRPAFAWHWHLADGLQLHGRVMTRGFHPGRRGQGAVLMSSSS